jgi:hypothetical protein
MGNVTRKAQKKYKKTPKNSGDFFGVFLAYFLRF